jgi:hypothetical protein
MRLLLWSPEEKRPARLVSSAVWSRRGGPVSRSSAAAIGEKWNRRRFGRRRRADGLIPGMPAVPRNGVRWRRAEPSLVRLGARMIARAPVGDLRARTAASEYHRGREGPIVER